MIKSKQKVFLNMTSGATGLKPNQIGNFMIQIGSSYPDPQNFQIWSLVQPIPI